MRIGGWSRGGRVDMGGGEARIRGTIVLAPNNLALAAMPVLS
jgi:hypothetical protein